MMTEYFFFSGELSLHYINVQVVKCILIIVYLQENTIQYYI